MTITNMIMRTCEEEFMMGQTQYLLYNVSVIRQDKADDEDCTFTESDGENHTFIEADEEGHTFKEVDGEDHTFKENSDKILRYMVNISFL
jgi:hypothetical protein